jgi:hypothetical protein
MKISNLDELRDRYERLRDAKLTPLAAIRSMFVNTRLYRVIHILRGRPIMNGVKFASGISLGENENLLISDCYFQIKDEAIKDA